MSVLGIHLGLLTWYLEICLPTVAVYYNSLNMSQSTVDGGTGNVFSICRGCNVQIKRDRIQCSDNKHFFHPGCIKSSLINNDRCKYCANHKKRLNSMGSTSNLSSVSNLSGGFDIEKAIEDKLKVFSESTERLIKATISDSMTSI